MSMAKKKDEGFDTHLPPAGKDAGQHSSPDGFRQREATPSSVKLSAGASRPLSAPRKSGVAERELPAKSGIAQDETLPKPAVAQGALPSASVAAKSEKSDLASKSVPGKGVAPRGPAPRHVPRKALAARPELSASDVEWWAESALNTTFESSRVVPADDPSDPNYGDRVTPVFLESITPVFPESKVREVMALADAVEKASSVTLKALPPTTGAAAAGPTANPTPESLVVATAAPVVAPPPSGPPAVVTHAVRLAVEDPALWNVPPSEAPAPMPTSHSRPVAPPLPSPSRARKKTIDAHVRPPTATFERPQARVLPAALPGVFEPDVEELHAVSLASGGAHVTLAIWIAVVLILIMVAATMATVG